MVECPNCAFRNAESDGFCGSCGLFLWPEAYAGVAGPAGTASGTAAAGRAPAQPGGRPASIPPGRRPEAPAAGAPVQCRACGRPNAPARRFCGHCGSSLARASSYVAEPPPAPPVVPEPWWRRFVWWRRKRALPVHRAGTRPNRRAEREPWDPEGRANKRASGGRTALRWLRRTWRRIWPDVFLILLILTLIALLFPGARRSVVNLFRDDPLEYLEPRFCVEPPQQGDSLSQYPPASACDRKADTFWATSRFGVGATAATVQARNPRLWIDFPAGVHLHEVRITAADIPLAELSSELLRDSGRPDQICIKVYDSVAHRDAHYEAVANRQTSPREVRQKATIAVPPGEASVTSANCATLKDAGPIDDDAEEHRFDVDLAGVGADLPHGAEAVSLEFRKVHKTQSGDEPTNVYVSGVEFFGRAVEEPDRDGKS